MYRSNINRGNHTGTSGLSPLRSLNSTVTSEKTSTSQAIIEPKNVIRIIAFTCKMELN